MRTTNQPELYINRNCKAVDIVMSKAEIVSALEYSEEYARSNNGIYPYIYVTTAGKIRDISGGGNKVSFLAVLDDFASFPEWGLDGFGIHPTLYHFSYR